MLDTARYRKEVEETGELLPGVEVILASERFRVPFGYQVACLLPFHHFCAPLHTSASLLSGGFATGYTLSQRRLPAKETLSMKSILALLGGPGVTGTGLLRRKHRR